MVKISPSNAGDASLILDWGSKVPHVSGTKKQTKKNLPIKQKQCCSKFNKDLKNDPHQKNVPYI